MKVLLNSFHLNGHTLGFHPQTQKLETHLLTQGLTLGVKGLKTGFVRVLEFLESPGILFWYFPGPETPGKRVIIFSRSWKVQEVK